MARYTGPKARISRRFGEAILGGAKALQRKAYAPGMHGKGRKRKQSEYAIQLNEKQKAKYTYGVLERQFSNTFKKGAKKDGIKGLNLLRLLEARLDNIVYRLGVASSRRAARQIVLHKHIVVNGKVVNIPSFTVKIGDVIEVREKSKTLEVITESVSLRSAKKYSWLEFDSTTLVGRVLAQPERDQIPENINEQLIVELYSK
jgi:small subunit ribosomal protein S4